MKCITCQNELNNDKIYLVKEMMYGYRDEFKYYHCSKCGCLQINKIPKDLEKYYPKDYYSYSKPNIRSNYFFNYLKQKRSDYCIGKKNFIGLLISELYGTTHWQEWFKKIKINYSDKILDVGSGNGDLLLNMKLDGFKNLYGIDPYLQEDNILYSEVNLRKIDIYEVYDFFDLIMLNHSFEHMPDPLNVLKKINSLLLKFKFLMIRIPVMGTKAWNIYRENWFSLDAPRHLHIQTLESMEILSSKTGFKIYDVVFDSGENQFWGSEQYKNNICLYDKNSYLTNPKNSIFTKRIISKYKNEAKYLNKIQQGDSAIFYLQKL